MGKAKINTNQHDNDDRPLKGLKNDGIIVLKCRQCEKDLLCLQLTSCGANRQSSVMTRVAVQCCLCGGSSCVEQISGQFYPGAPSDDMGFDIIEDDTGSIESDVLFQAWKK